MSVSNRPATRQGVLGKPPTAQGPHIKHEQGQILFAMLDIRRGGYGFNFYKDFSNRKHACPLPPERDFGDKVPKPGMVEFVGGVYTVDATDEKLLEFMRNSPECKGSDNQVKMGYAPVYYEVNPVAEAQVKIDRSDKIREALNAVAKASEKQLRELAISFGCMEADPTLQREACTSACITQPEKVLDRIGPKKELTRLMALVAWGTKHQHVENRRGMYYMNDRLMGQTTEDAAAWLQKETNAPFLTYLEDKYSEGDAPTG